MAVFRLPRLPVNWLTSPDLFRRYWDEAMSKIEETLNAILAIPAIEQALADLDSATQAALDAADAAQNAADGAAAATAASAAETSIVNSYITGFTPPLLTISDTGLVTIANHTRVYGDSTLNPSVSVTGGTISTGLPAGSAIRVYYDDPSRAGGGVTYQYTVDPAAPPVQSGNRHSVGAGVVPATGTEDGGYVRPPGWVELPLP